MNPIDELEGVIADIEAGCANVVSIRTLRRVAAEIERLTEQRDEARELNALWTQHVHKPVLMADNMRLRAALEAFVAAHTWISTNSFDGIDSPGRRLLDHADSLARAAPAGTAPAIQSREGDGGSDKARETIRGACDYLTDNIEPPNGMGKEQAAVLVLAGWLENATAE